MKCKNISNKINTFVVQKLKKFKLNGQTSSTTTTTTTMPAMPKEKTISSITTNDNKKYPDNNMKESIMSSPIIIVNNKKDSTSCCNNKIATGTIQHQHQNITGSSTTTTTTITPTSTGSSNNDLNSYKQQQQQQIIGNKKRGVNDFRFGKSIGEGSFSTVYIAKDIHTNREYAIKVCDKQHIIREKKNQYIIREREAMNVMSGVPGFVSLYCTFQDTNNLYFAMTYAKNGDVLPYINKVGSFDLDCTKFYAAELVIALELMHSRGVIHRDLKPENILLDDKMHSLIADFGSAKILNNDEKHHNDTTSKLNKSTTATTTTASTTTKQQQNTNNNDNNDNNKFRERKNSFVGTAQYVSPELLKGQITTKSSDLWALGCIIYQMISGLPPFRAMSEYLIFQNILKLELQFPDGFDNDARDLVEKLLVREPELRIGANDSNDIYTSIRQHPFFNGIEWKNLRQQVPPQIYPYLPGDELRSHYRIPDHLEPGLDDKQLQRLLGLELGTSDSGEQIVVPKKSIADLPEIEKDLRLENQKMDKYNQFVDGDVILKQGLVNKRKGLFARKRMLLLTTGPRLIYVDPVSMVKKGEIPWSPELRVEPKNFKIFFIHTPNRTYYLEEPEGFALNWCRDIEDVRLYTYGHDS